MFAGDSAGFGAEVEDGAVLAFDADVDGAAADIAIGDELLVRLAGVGRNLKALSAVGTLDGDPFVHVGLVIHPTPVCGRVPRGKCGKIIEATQRGGTLSWTGVFLRFTVKWI